MKVFRNRRQHEAEDEEVEPIHGVTERRSPQCPARFRIAIRRTRGVNRAESHILYLAHASPYASRSLGIKTSKDLCTGNLSQMARHEMPACAFLQFRRAFRAAWLRDRATGVEVTA